MIKFKIDPSLLERKKKNSKFLFFFSSLSEKYVNFMYVYTVNFDFKNYFF